MGERDFFRAGFRITKYENNKQKGGHTLFRGLDSTTVLYLALEQGYRCHCLLFDYGQRHDKELKSAIKLAERVRCPCTVINITLPWGGSSLLGKEKKFIPGKRSLVSKALPATYVPGRNTLFISFALSLAETIGAGTVFIGANAVDFSGYPDCRPPYYRAWNKLVRSLGTKVQVRAPLLRLTKAGIIRRGLRLGVPYQLTWSCYQGGKKPCGVCDSCILRAKGFAAAGMSDGLLNIPQRERAK